MSLRQVLDSRLVMITGKGGTGKSALSAALGSVLAERGLRTIVVEIDVFQPSLTELFGTPPTFQAQSVRPNLDICNITWREALEAWLERTVPGQRIVKLILGNRIVHHFLNATPGVRETVILSRILTLMEQYERVIVDLPASGHAISLLQVPNIAIDLMRGGPIRDRSKELLALFGAASTSLVITALPEEMVVNETVELWESLRERVPMLRLPLVVLNRAALPSLTDAERDLLLRLQESVSNDAARELLRAGAWEASLEESTATALDRIEAELGVPVLHFPRLGALGGFGGGPTRMLQQMASAIQRFELSERSREAG